MHVLFTHLQGILAKQTHARLLAIDVFRGLTIMAMILVNNPGSWHHIYAPMRHAEWHGWTLTDLIFPFFIFIVGIAIVLSANRQLAASKTRRDVIKLALFRMAKLFLLGWFLALFYYNFSAQSYNWFEQRAMSLRYMGVLQRIGLVYFICVSLFLFCSIRTIASLFVAILLFYWALLMFVPYHDDVGRTYVGLLEFGNNLSAWLDNQLFSADHLYYQSAQPFAFDPEGLLSTLPAIASGLSGILIGHYLIQNKPPIHSKIITLFCVGLVSVLLAEFWALSLPINKALWTSSFVLLSAGYACLTLAVLLWLLDVKRYTLWSAPFVVLGANSIAFYMFAGVLARLLGMIQVGDTSLKAWLYQHVFQAVFGQLNGSLGFAIAFLMLCYLVMYGLYRKGIFWKV